MCAKRNNLKEGENTGECISAREANQVGVQGRPPRNSNEVSGVGRGGAGKRAEILPQAKTEQSVLCDDVFHVKQ